MTTRTHTLRHDSEIELGEIYYDSSYGYSVAIIVDKGLWDTVHSRSSADNALEEAARRIQGLREVRATLKIHSRGGLDG